MVGSPDRLLPGWEDAPAFREPFGCDPRLLIDERHHLAPQVHALRAVVWNAQAHEHVRPAHHAETDATDGLRQAVDLIERVAVRVDDVVEEVHREVHDTTQALPIDPGERIALTGAEIALHEGRQIHASEVADVVGSKRLLSALCCHQSIYDDRVGVELGRAEHVLAARGLDGLDRGEEALAIRNLLLAGEPGLRLLLLGGGEETDLREEAVAIDLVQDELVLRAIGVILHPAVAVGHGLDARLTAQLQARDDSEVLEEDLHLAQELGLAAGESDAAAPVVGAGDVHRAVCREDGL